MTYLCLPFLRGRTSACPICANVMSSNEARRLGEGVDAHRCPVMNAAACKDMNDTDGDVSIKEVIIGDKRDMAGKG